MNAVASRAHCVKVVEDVVIKKFTFAISSPDGLLVRLLLDLEMNAHATVSTSRTSPN